MGRFQIVGEDAILDGRCTDIYFKRVVDVMEKDGVNPHVTMEVTAAALPDRWGVLCGLDDVVRLLERLPVDVDAMPEGSVFSANEPVLRVSGRYRDFAVYETAILGFLCHASGVASAAAHIRLAARDRPVYSFGSRRQHPAISAMIERAAWIGGVDGASSTCAPEGVPLAGTMPHAFVMCYPRQEDAWCAFARGAGPEVPRIMLADTFSDEKDEAVRAAACGATAVRLDTPRSRRGDMRTIVEEVRWELDVHGYSDVKIFLSGGLSRADVVAYRDIADAFGIGGAIANAPVIDFSMDIVEMEGRPYAKRGKRSGAKQVYEAAGGRRVTLPLTAPAPEGATPLLSRYVEHGIIVARPNMEDARERVLSRLPDLAGE
ncbi:MAG: Quinolinate phosphoribosyl transferase [Methanoculleus marisnigri]|uniref:Quinolinate phosphoribosyl transferase n=1 Tax=Methanoculleus marisnigri TaxID=2198 RepID=A0A101IUB7_9EURY|nr:nicotinate phosphoribosyltransferase [Methanoculleus marisnigri]KUL01239.1 MAG: Quinolinate phosphoribosyl transferase [Methanoculleus marisnigri]